MPNRRPAIVILFLSQTFSPSLIAYDFTPQISGLAFAYLLRLSHAVDPKRPRKEVGGENKKRSRAVPRFRFQIRPRRQAATSSQHPPLRLSAFLSASASPGGLKREMCYRVRGELIVLSYRVPGFSRTWCYVVRPRSAGASCFCWAASTRDIEGSVKSDTTSKARLGVSWSRGFVILMIHLVWY